jgi:hypothetical protein
MEYTTPPRSGNIRPDPVQVWGGGFFTAIIAALVALVGILICRWMLGIDILAPKSDGAWGGADTAAYVIAAAVVALVATALLYLMMLGTPQPTMFLGWIMGLATVVAVVYPFSTSAPIDQKIATAVVNLVLGIAITSLLTNVATRAVRSVETRRRDYDRGVPGGRGYDDRYPPRDGYGEPGYRDRGGYERGEYGRPDYDRGGREHNSGGYPDRGEQPTARYPQDRDDRWR